jgi:hypothetical protein
MDTLVSSLPSSLSLLACLATVVARKQLAQKCVFASAQDCLISMKLREHVGSVIDSVLSPATPWGGGNRILSGQTLLL